MKMRRVLPVCPETVARLDTPGRIPAIRRAPWAVVVSCRVHDSRRHRFPLPSSATANGLIIAGCVLWESPAMPCSFPPIASRATRREEGNAQCAREAVVEPSQPYYQRLEARESVSLFSVTAGGARICSAARRPASLWQGKRGGHRYEVAYQLSHRVSESVYCLDRGAECRPLARRSDIVLRSQCRDVEHGSRNHARRTSRWFRGVEDQLAARLPILYGGI